MNYPLVSIITINFNQPVVTCELLDSLRNITYPEIEILVIDNGSKKNPIEIEIERKYPEIRVIRSKENLGFAGGNNLGVKKANGKYMLFLNNDTEVDPGFLEPLVRAFENDDTIGLATPKLRFFFSENKQTLQYAGGKAINIYTGRGSYIGYGELDTGQYNKSQYTELIHGAAVMVPLSVLQKTGLMPDIYFLYYEELDWCENIKRSGYKLKYIANSIVYHKESMSIGKKNPLKSYYMARNRIIFLRRNTTFINILISSLFIMVFTIPKTIFMHLIKREFNLLSAFCKGIIWNFTHFKNIKQNPQF